MHLDVQTSFVISGFAIAGSLDCAIARGASALAFVRRRIARIYVPHLFGLAFAALILPTLTGLLPVLKGNRPLFQHYCTCSGWDWLGIVTLTKPSFENVVITDSFRPLNPALRYVCAIMQMYTIVALAVCFRAKAKAFLAAITVLAFMPWVPRVSGPVPKGLFLPFWPYFYVGMLLLWAVQKEWYRSRSTVGAWQTAALAWFGLGPFLRKAGQHQGHGRPADGSSGDTARRNTAARELRRQPRESGFGGARPDRWVPAMAVARLDPPWTCAS